MDLNDITLEAKEIDGQPIFVNASPLMSVDEGGAREVLSEYRWPEGLQDAFVQNLVKIPLRFIVCDDSGSMASTDGHKLVVNGGFMQLTQCSRWAELADSLRIHSKIAKYCHAPTEFRFLNQAQPIMIGTADNDEVGRYSVLQSILDGQPSGGTPLCCHINHIVDRIRALEPQLRAAAQKVCLIIFTDGESSDGDIAEAMRPLKTLPVSVVLRLCTDQDRIVQYWNNIDKELELDMDVLDDFCGEGYEVHRVNPWVTYGEPMHRLREFGIHLKEFDLLDEAHLSLEQTRRFSWLIFGGKLDDYPHPEADFASFLAFIEQKNNNAHQVWHPVDHALRHWVNMAKLKKKDPKTGCCVIG